MALYFGTFADASLNVGLRNDYAFSNFTLFDQNSYWDGYLTDLYSFPAYIWIGTNQSQSGSMTSNSSVVYQFYVASTGNLTIDLSPPAGCDDDVYLIHTNAVMARSYSGSYAVHERINYNAAARGWYLVMVNRYSATSYTVTNQSYSLVVSNQGAGIR